MQSPGFTRLRFWLQPLAFLNEYVEVSSGTVFIRQKASCGVFFHMQGQVVPLGHAKSDKVTRQLRK